MLQSMTAFSRQEQSFEFGQLAWEIRSVNHRYLDTSFRLPEEFRALESKLREKIAKKLKRGKVDCSLRYKANAALTASDIVINETYLAQIVAATKRIDEETGSKTELNAIELLRIPGVTEESDKDFTPIHKSALALFDDCLAAVVEARKNEGSKLEPLIADRCKEISRLVALVKERRPQVLEALDTKLRERLTEVAERGDPGRLEQELVIYAQKMDVAEELDRLDCHIQEVDKILEANQPAGRRLDFLMQEFNREANTLSSKSQDPETTKHAVDIKVLIEQMREQVQNIE